MASLTSTLGTAAIAANAVANTTSTFLNIPASAVGMAVLTVVGQCLGAGEKEPAVWYARRLLLVAYCGAWVLNLSGFFFADRWALSWFNLSPEAQAMALADFLERLPLAQRLDALAEDLRREGRG